MSLIDVRVLGSDGVGLTSDVIAGIDWAIANRARYNIRVINLSLGHPVTEPSTTDPLCQAVARAVTAGIVVVTSAGNYGDQRVGRSGARRHHLSGKFAAGDHRRSDRYVRDAVDLRRSRGAVQLARADRVRDGGQAGRRCTGHASWSRSKCRAPISARAFPQWHIAGTGKNAYMRLSGTSMAAAVVSGGVALLLDAQPSMSPAQVKIALQMGARYMPDGGLIGGGAGQRELRAVAEGLADRPRAVAPQHGHEPARAVERRRVPRPRHVDRPASTIGPGCACSACSISARCSVGAEDGEWGVLNLLGLTNPLGVAAAEPSRLGHRSRTGRAATT